MQYRKVNIDFGSVESIIEDNMLEIGKKAQLEVKENTPELTGDLEENIDLGKVQKNNNSISIEVFTDLSIIPYAGIVEEGVKGKKYQYHKPKGVPFGPKQVGAGMYEKVATEFQKTASRLV